MSHFHTKIKDGKFSKTSKHFPKKNSQDSICPTTVIRKSSYRHQDQLCEGEVGITQYISCLDGYQAVIKARFSDFQVNEINKDNRVAKLTDVSVPKVFNTSVKNSEENVSYKDMLESPLEKLPQSTWESIKALVGASEYSPVELNAENFSKEERKEIHSCVKSYFGKAVVSSTIMKDGKTVMEFKKWNKKNKDNRSEWPANTPEYVYFIVYKEMMDTMDACFKIAKALRIPPAKVTYAGLKDKRAKTSQWCCIKKYQPSKLVYNLNKIRNLKVGNVEYKKQCLKLGDLRGNWFRIALRNVKADNDLIEASIKHVKQKGFINYYGLQRFGNEKLVPTYLIGLKLLQGAWKEAVNLILKVKPGDDSTLLINTAKQIYADTGDAAKAFQVCDKRQNSLEAKLLEGLTKNHGNDYVNALEYIPRGIRLMYLHAFQSLIWNKLASKRIEQFGLQPVEGDLILVEEIEDEVVEDDNVECEAISNNYKKRSNEESIDPKKGKGAKTPVRPLSAEELDQFTIFDVVLPLPGYDVVYPDNLKVHYKEVIEEYGLKLEMPKQRVKTYNLSGTYRKLVQTVKDLEWKILYYNDPTDNLIRSDLEELNGEPEPQSVEDGRYKAIVVSFTLNPASYATMVLREILKCNTSSSSQAELNNYAPNDTSNDIEKVKMESLLTNKEKYEDFMNNLFKDLADSECGETAKRRLDSSDTEDTIQVKKTRIES